MWKTKPQKNKQVRKPIHSNFAPKRLAINYDPPMIIMEYLAVTTGKLYHHKIRLASILAKDNVTKQQILNYIKTKHHLYFVNGKIKDAQLYKLIDKILQRRNLLSKTDKQNNFAQAQMSTRNHLKPQTKNDDDFEYLNDEDQEQYQQDYQTYKQNEFPMKQNINNQNKVQQPKKQNAFMTANQQEEDEEAAQWDLDMDENADFV